MSKPIEFKAGTLTAMTAVVRDLDNVQLAHTLHTMLGGMGEFFAGEATVVDLTQLTNIPKRVDWSGLASLLRRYGLQPVAVKGAPEELEDGAKKAGFAVLSQVAGKTSGDKAVALEQKKKEQETTAAQVELPMDTTAPEAAASPAASTMIIDRSVRSGQQIYARGTDLVILGGVSNGAEVIADGSIHCYGPLRGRALAGAQGNVSARLWCTNFGPELISIAGVYRTFERGIAENLAGKSVHARLHAATGKSAEEKHTLSIEPLQLD